MKQSFLHIKSVFFMLFLMLGGVMVSCQKSESPIEIEDEEDEEEEELVALPTVYVTTPGGVGITSKDVWTENCTLKIEEADGTVTDLGAMSFRGRGNSTWSYPKKPYAIKLDKKQEVMGMPKHKRWVLLANWMDRTMMRNAVAFEIARKTKSLEWTPNGKFVELVLNGKHVGNYYLCEQVKIDKNRVNVAELKSTDTDEKNITGGYLFELDVYFDEVNKFKTALQGLPVMIKEPDEDVLVKEQLMYANNYFDTVEKALYGKKTPETADYEKYIDMDTFIDWWFVNELAGNGEPNHPKSSYMHKDRGGRLKAGPVWDYDWGTFTPGRSGLITKNAIWYDALFRDPQFVARVKTKWAESKADFESVCTFITETAKTLRDSDEKNSRMWPISSKVNGDETMTFDQATNRLLNAYKERLAAVDAAIKNL